MKRLFTVVALVVALPLFVRADDLKTDYEASGYLRTPRYPETVAYCKRLAKASPWVHYTTFGTTPQGRELPLLIADKEGSFEPARVDRAQKAVLLIQACIHAGECDGKDAGFMLLRDIAATKQYAGLLDHATILFIPIFNVDGHEHFGPYNRINQNGPEEMGYRVTAQLLNLNRDYLKVDAPEMRAWIDLYSRWQPDFVVDCHATDGADYQYVLTYMLTTHGMAPPSVTEWARDGFLPEVKEKMAARGYDLCDYVLPLQWPDIRSGLQATVSPPRFSTGYVAIRNRPALLIETHMLKDYRTRVTGTYELLKETLAYLNANHASLRAAIETADRYTASPAFREKPYPLAWERDEEGGKVAFEGYAYTSRESDLTGGKWFEFSHTPETFEVDYYGVHPSVFADLPEAYIIPPEWTDVIERIELHGVHTSRLSQARTITVSSCRFSNLAWKETPFEGRHTVTFERETIEQERTFPAGSVVIDMNQRSAPVVAHILEPQGPDSYVLWGFFDGIFEQKEYAESYVMEKMAREMLEDDPGLREEFEKVKDERKGFAEDPWAQLNWFYQHSPYWDDRINVYPVGKIFDAAILRDLPLRDQR